MAGASTGELPVPLKVTASGEPGALLVRETDPDALPEAEGANETLKLVLVPGVMVSGVVKPVIANPAPETIA